MRRLLLLFSLAALPAVAQEPLRLVTAELPPYTFQVPPASISEIPGPGQGLVHEVVTEMAKRLGHPGNIEYMPWHRAQDLALTQPNVGILSLTRSPERENRYTWLARIVTDDLVLVGGLGVDASSLDKVKDRPTGVLYRSGAEALLKEHGFTRIEPAFEEWANATKIKLQRIDAWVAPRLMVIHAYKEATGDPSTLNIGSVIRRSEIWLAASKCLPDEEVKRWAEAFEQVKADGTYARIAQKYDRIKVLPIEDDLRRHLDDPFTQVR